MLVNILISSMQKKIKKMKVKPLQAKLLLGMANYDFGSEGWQCYKPILKKGKFTSQETNFSKYITPLIKVGVVERRELKYKDNRRREHKKKQYRLERGLNSFCNIFLGFFDNNIASLFFESNYYQELQDYITVHISKGLKDEWDSRNETYPAVYAHAIRNHNKILFDDKSKYSAEFYKFKEPKGWVKKKEASK